MDKLSQKEYKILSYLYQLRVLTFQEIEEYILKDTSRRYIENIVSKLVKDEYIEKHGRYKDDAYYQIKQKGVKYLDINGLLPLAGSTPNIYPLLPASKIKISDTTSAHQAALNHFVLRRADEKDFEYYDEKYLSKIISGARPDGIIVDDKYYFLEMDMNTEREKALNLKWSHYRNFLTSESFYNMKQKVMGLFILGGNIRGVSLRRSYLRKQILSSIPDLLSKKFNFVIGTEDRLFDILNSSPKNEIAGYFNKEGYRIGRGELSKGGLNGFTFDIYAAKSASDGKVLSKNGDAKEFIIDDLTDGNLYSLYKLSAIASVESSFNYVYHRNIKCIEVVNNEDEAYEICKELDTFNEKVYFTTLSRLNTHSLNSALFQIDRYGNRWHFSEESLRMKIEE